MNDTVLDLIDDTLANPDDYYPGTSIYGSMQYERKFLAQLPSGDKRFTVTVLVDPDHDRIITAYAGRLDGHVFNFPCRCE